MPPPSCWRGARSRATPRPGEGALEGGRFPVAAYSPPPAISNLPLAQDPRMDKEVDPKVLAVIDEMRLSGPRLTPVDIVAKMGVFDAREMPRHR